VRIAVVLVVLAVLGWLFLVQKQQDHQRVEVAGKIPAQAASPRPVSEHNWAKHALDKTNKVTRQVAEQRKADGTR
jgi:threonine/homoserine efflux transporter RhtA